MKVWWWRGIGGWGWDRGGGGGGRKMPPDRMDYFLTLLHSPIPYNHVHAKPKKGPSDRLPMSLFDYWTLNAMAIILPTVGYANQVISFTSDMLASDLV
ncbi:hypothetical protein K435DRAFT_881607 [Dendrothele bispora CBS 962.96]|uniref:Uncharacterized protein n=1 Tax=Dendrothele bispora (strain CBS 962.96) TaxID=1314807 RepID=A0A4S8KI81_DENBC|nr:hypothetical protein K435DRAFT_881607 [Dendrothele bispora CBS 962.96]